MNTPLRYGSLCSGVGMLDRAAEAVLGPVRRVFHTETCEDASTVLAAHHPDVPNLGDIRTVDWATAPAVDVLVGGIPCQPWSNAGKRQGTDDERDLWPVVKTDPDGLPRRGAVDAIQALRPRLVLLENVPGLLTAEHGWPFGTILADLDDLGYDVRWTTFGACKVGACHHRHRVYVYARLAGGRRGGGSSRRPVGVAAAVRHGGRWAVPDDALFGEPGPVVWPMAGRVVSGGMWPAVADPCGVPEVRPKRATDSAGQDGLFDLADVAGHGELLPTPTARVAGDRGTPSLETAERRIHVEGRRNLEDAIALLPTPTASDTTGAGHTSTGGLNLRTAVSMFPTPTARDATRGKGWADTQSGRPLSEVVALLSTPVATDHDGGPGRRNTRGKPMLPGAVALMPTPRASDGDKGGPNQRGSSGDWALPAAVQPSRFGAYESAVRGQEAAFGMPAPEPTEPGRQNRPRLAAAFCEWMMACPAGWITNHLDPGTTAGRKAVIKAAGNGVVEPAAVEAFRLLGVQPAALVKTRNPRTPVSAPADINQERTPAA